MHSYLLSKVSFIIILQLEIVCIPFVILKFIIMMLRAKERESSI